MCAGLFRIFIDMRRKLTTTQGVAKFGPQETAGRIPGGAGIEPVRKISDHCGILVEYIGINTEIVVVDDHMGLASCGGKHGFNNPPNPFNILMASNDMAFEFDEELVLVGMTCEALLKRHAQQ